MTNKKVFITADVFFAFIDRAHPKHLQASAYFRYFAQERIQIFTTITMVNTAYKMIYEHISPSLAKDFIRALALSSLNIMYPEEADFKSTLKTLTSINSNELQFDEALMAVLCNKRSIPQICTFSYFHQLFGLSLFYLPI